jgi:hypothetical protein
MIKTKENIKKLEEQMKSFINGLKKESFFIYETGVEGSFVAIEDVKHKVHDF